MNTAYMKTPAALALGAMLVLSGFAFAGQAEAQVNGNVTGTVTTQNSNATSTATSTDMATLQVRIMELESRLAALQSSFSDLLARFQTFIGGQGSNGGGTGTTTPGGTNATSSASIRIYPENASIRAGTNIDFNGRGFWADETVTISKSGQTIGTARADGGGNFSTGSMSVGTGIGSQTYTFRGGWSGMVGTTSVTVVP